MFIDIHTHHIINTPDTWCLLNLEKGASPLKHPCSIGLHPWNVQKETMTEAFSLIKNQASLPEVFAIGECGLDRVCNTEWSLQLKAFQWHIALSNQVKKPLMVHAVRSHQDILQLLKKFQHQQAVIFHGVNHKGIDKLWQAGHYVSFGKALLNPNSEATKAFKTVATDCFFLETDDAEIDIKTIYEVASKIKNVSVEQLKAMVEQNFNTIFA